jgi:hypothetical protein
MSKFIAERKLMYSIKGESKRYDLVIGLTPPYWVKESPDGNYRYEHELCVCRVEFDGLPELLIREAYGTDSVQAVGLASNIDGYIRGLEKKYDIFWPTGEPYFE